MAMDTDFDAAATRIMEYYRTLGPDTVEDLRKLASPDLHWQDPITEVEGIDRLSDYWHKMNNYLTDMKFEIKDYSRNGQILFLQMLMTFQLKRMPGKKQEVDYVQKIVFDDAGLIADAKEYWDLTPALEAIPVLGKVVTFTKKMIKKQFS